MSTDSTGQPQPAPSTPPEASEPLLRMVDFARRPLDRFLRIEAASGIVLLAAAAVALVLANSPWAGPYADLWHTPVGIRLGGFAFERSLEWFVNDVLMVIFFFVVGMEIRLEMHDGLISDWRRAVLPASAALGGMLAPAALYLAIAGAPETFSGWGVPMATDIAFAVGILTLLGSRVPPALRMLLLAVAVIDDLGAIVVIAIFYSSGVAVSALLVAALGFLGVVAMQRIGVRSKVAYIAPSVVVWAGIYAAGIHPTVAGVIVGLVTPVRAWFGPDGFLVAARDEVGRLAEATPGALSHGELADILRRVERASREAVSPAQWLIETLHPWVAFGIMPIFALANAGVSVGGDSLDPASWSVVTAIVVGLVVGKPAGVMLASWLALRLGVASLPEGITMRHLAVLGVVAGVGFTMALFIAQLAFTDPKLLVAAKIGVLLASAIAAILGLAGGRLLLAPGEGREPARGH